MSAAFKIEMRVVNIVPAASEVICPHCEKVLDHDVPERIETSGGIIKMMLQNPIPASDDQRPTMGHQELYENAPIVVKIQEFEATGKDEGYILLNQTEYDILLDRFKRFRWPGMPDGMVHMVPIIHKAEEIETELRAISDQS